MSHIDEIQIDCNDLAALRLMAGLLGLEFVEGQQTYRWYGRSVGDYPLPIGFTAEDLGKCEHAMRIPGSPHSYEIGVVKRRDGKPGYTLLWDFWQGGYGLEEKVGVGAVELKRQYGVACAKLTAQRKGYSFTQRILPNGKIAVQLSDGK